MKIRNQHIASLVKRLKRPHGGLRSPQIMHPMREWVIGLTVAVILFGVAAVWGATTYMTYRDTVTSDADIEQVSNAVYRAQQIEQSLDMLRARSAEHQTLIGMVPASTTIPEDAIGIGESAASTTEAAAIESDDVSASTTPDFTATETDAAAVGTTDGTSTASSSATE